MESPLGKCAGLAIIDSAYREQPTFNEDHSVRVILNGENLQLIASLRPTLENTRPTFRSVPTQKFARISNEEYGLDMVHTSTCMFAFACDDKRRRFSCARSLR